MDSETFCHTCVFIGFSWYCFTIYLNVSACLFGAFKAFFSSILLLYCQVLKTVFLLTHLFVGCFDFAPSGHWSPPHSVGPNVGRVIGLISKLVVYLWVFTVTKLDDFFHCCASPWQPMLENLPVLEKIRLDQRSHV